jgi:hypothetical protein
MSEIVERAAAVIAAEIMELTADQRRKFVFPDDANGDTCDRARSAARAVIAALRLPTYPMIDAGGEAIYHLTGDPTPAVEGQAQVAWPAMIDAALK